MSRTFRRIMPVVALSLATLLGGCVIEPGHGGHFWGGHGWGWRR
jgi:hypothetical protein